MTNHRKLIAQCLGGVLALPLLYVASSGPVLRIASKKSAVRTVYDPLFRLTDWTAFNRPLMAYLDWFGVDGYQIVRQVELPPP